MRRHITILFLVIVLSVLSAGFAGACDWCLLSQGISPLTTMRGSGVRVSERYTLLESVYDGTAEIPNPGAKEEYWTTEFTAFTDVTRDLTLFFVVPLRKTGLDGHLHVMDGMAEAEPVKGDASGLGDIAIMGRRTFFERHTVDKTLKAAGLFGVRLPTGRTDAKTNDGMEYLDSHLQPGTGSTDFLLGLSLSRASGMSSLSLNLLGAITTRGEAGNVRHRFGNSLNYDLTAGYRVYPAGAISSAQQVFLALGLNGELRAREEEDGVEVKDSGGHTLYLTPGVQIVSAPHFVFEFSYWHPIYHNLYGVQLGEDRRMTGAVTYLF